MSRRARNRGDCKAHMMAGIAAMHRARSTRPRRGLDAERHARSRAGMLRLRDEPRLRAVRKRHASGDRPLRCGPRHHVVAQDRAGDEKGVAPADEVRAAIGLVLLRSTWPRFTSRCTTIARRSGVSEIVGAMRAGGSCRGGGDCAGLRQPSSGAEREASNPTSATREMTNHPQRNAPAGWSTVGSLMTSSPTVGTMVRGFFSTVHFPACADTE